MKIEKTCEYKMRNGLKAIVCSLNRHGDQPILGFAAIAENGKDQALSWFSNGCYLFSGANHIYDIVAEWTEPKPPQYVPYVWEDREQLRGRWYRPKDNDESDCSEDQITKLGLEDAVFTVNGIAAYLFLEEYEWLDGTPCGKVVEE